MTIIMAMRMKCLNRYRLTIAIGAMLARMPPERHRTPGRGSK